MRNPQPCMMPSSFGNGLHRPIDGIGQRSRRPCSLRMEASWPILGGQSAERSPLAGLVPSPRYGGGREKFDLCLTLPRAVTGASPLPRVGVAKVRRGTLHVAATAEPEAINIETWTA